MSGEPAATGPRIPPKPESEWDDETRALLRRNLPGGGRILNIFRTLAHHPKLLKRWLVFGAHVLSKSSLPERDRELAILRVAWRCRSPYEWGQHVVIARRAGLTDGEIARVAKGPDAPGWDPGEVALLRAVDELHDDSCITDATWAVLAARYDERQMLDAIFTAGQYRLIAMALNSARIERDDGLGAAGAVDGVPFPERE